MSDSYQRFLHHYDGGHPILSALLAADTTAEAAAAVADAKGWVDVLHHEIVPTWDGATASLLTHVGTHAPHESARYDQRLTPESGNARRGSTDVVFSRPFLNEDHRIYTLCLNVFLVRMQHLITSGQRPRRRRIASPAIARPALATDTDREYSERIERWRVREGHPPSAQDDDQWRADHGLSRDRMRQLRQKYLTAEEKKGGRRREKPREN